MPVNTLGAVGAVGAFLFSLLPPLSAFLSFSVKEHILILILSAAFAPCIAVVLCFVGDGEFAYSFEFEETTVNYALRLNRMPSLSMKRSLSIHISANLFIINITNII